MERAPFPLLLLLLPLVVPTAAAEDLVAAALAGLCVDPQGPSVKYNDCGPHVPDIGIVIVVGTSSGTMEKRIGCQSDCDYELRICALFATKDASSPIHTNPDLEEMVEGKVADAWRDVIRYFRLPEVLDAEFGENPPAPGTCLVRT